MNKRLIKKKLKQLNIKTNKIRPGENDIITIFVDYNKYKMAEIDLLYKNLKKLITKNEIIILPKDMKIELNRKEQIIKHIENL